MLNGKGSEIPNLLMIKIQTRLVGKSYWNLIDDQRI